MTFALAYWVLMLVWFVFGLYTNYAGGPGALGNTVLLFVLFLLLGWKVFGSPIHG